MSRKKTAVVKEDEEDEEVEHEDEDDDEKESFPPKVMKRIDALEKLHDTNIADIDKEYKKERATLEQKYLIIRKTVYEQRRQIIAGEVEAPETTESEKSASEKEIVITPADENVKGIPGFWFRALANHPAIGDYITEEDVPALESLMDITVSYNESYSSFTIVFQFAENPFFSNTTLEKTYTLTPDILEEKSPTLSGSSGTTILWKPSKDLTVTEVKKKQKAKSGKNKGQVRTVTRLEPKASFFHYFSDPVEEPEDEEEEEEREPNVKINIEEDYDIAHALRTDIVPDAVKWFTGEAVPDLDYDDDDDEDDDEDDDDDKDEDDDDDDDEEEEDRKKKPKSKPHGKGKATGFGAAGGSTGDEQKDCKAQ